jgi:hypothetical protein
VQIYTGNGPRFSHENGSYARAVAELRCGP